MNSDGRSAGLTSPNAAAQTELICNAWRDAQVEPESVTYMEVHGTGTSLGDPIEYEGLKKAFERFTGRKQFCAVGSVKTNLGHLDTAAGLLGAVKAICALQNKTLPPSIHFRIPNRKIDFENSALYVCGKPEPWESPAYPRRCGVTSFGLSGTNAHVVLEEAESYAKKSREVKDDVRVLVLSGTTEAAVRRLVSRYHEFIKDERNSLSIDEVCFTANTGRGDYAIRTAFLFKTVQELLSQMERAIASREWQTNEKTGFLYGIADAGQDIGQNTEADIQLLGKIRDEKDLAAKYQGILTLCRQYVKGYAIAWKILYEKKRYYKISLPGYPFEKNRCWINMGEGQEDLSTGLAGKAAVYRQDISDRALDKVTVKKEAGKVAEPLTVRIAQIIAYCLGYQAVSLKDNYYQLGGDSIQAIKVVNSINEILHIHMSVADLLKSSTIQELGAGITAAQDSQELIMPVVRQEAYELSSAQQRIYYACILEGNTTKYNMTNAVIIKGEIDQERLQEAFRALADRHESMRTGFVLADGTPQMKISETVKLDLEYEQSDVAENEIERIVRTFRKPFDLERAPLLRIKLVRVSTDKHYLLYDVHHMVFDGYSFGVVLKDLVRLYHNDTLEPLTVQYKDYAVWHNNRLKSAQLKEQEAYWQKEFAKTIPYTLIPPHKESREKSADSPGSLWLRLEREDTEKLKHIALQSKATVFMTLLSIYGILISRYTGQEEVVIGSPVAGRNHRQTQDIIGNFINLLALKIKVRPNSYFKGFLEEVKETCAKAYENQDYPFQNILPNDSIFNVLFAFHSNLKSQALTYGDWHIEECEYDINTATLDIIMDAEETDEGLLFNLSFDGGRYEHIFMQFMLDNYKVLLKQVIDHPDMKLEKLISLSGSEESRLIKEYGQGEQAVWQEETIISRYEDVSKRNNENTAIRCNDRHMSYKELEQRSRKVAAALQRYGAARHKVIAFMLNRTVNLPVGMIAILRSGAAYLPLDPGMPAEQLGYMLKDSHADMILTESRIISGLPTEIKQYPLINIDEGVNGPEDFTGAYKYTGDSLAYIIYTSGSTGKPKGVMIEHKSLYNFTISMKQLLGLIEGQRILALTTVSFDIWGLESICAMALGLECVLADEAQQKDIFLLERLIVENQVEIIQATPSRMAMILEHDNCEAMLSQIKMLLIGGEKLENALYKRLRKVYKNKIFNMYGPSETTIWSAVKEIVTEDITVGRPIHNTSFYIMDAGCKLRPLGCAGELYIGGRGLARGYINNKELTEERFVISPYDSQEKIYRTGDMARWNVDGDIELIGRNDNQVKLNGHRIELGGIETVLMEYAGIQRAAVLKWEEESGSYLCAYVTGKADIDLLAVKQFLKTRLPPYMIPKFFLSLAKMPLTANEKVDKKRLPKPGSRKTSATVKKEASGDIEKRILAVWEEVLGTEQIGLDDNFFDIGGDSVLLVKLQAKLKKEFGWEISIADFFENSTIIKLAGLLSTKPGSHQEGFTGRVCVSAAFMAKGQHSGGHAALSYMLEGEWSQKRLFTSLAACVYEISEENAFTLYTNLPDDNMISILNFEREKKIEDSEAMAAFLQEVEQKLSSGYKETAINMKKRALPLKGNNIRILFLNGHIKESLLSVCDIVIETATAASSVKINMEYSERLSRDSMKKLLSYYIQMIKAVGQ